MIKGKRDWGFSFDDGGIGESKAYWNERLDGVGPVDNRPSTNKLHHLIT